MGDALIFVFFAFQIFLFVYFTGCAFRHAESARRTQQGEAASQTGVGWRIVRTMQARAAKRLTKTGYTLRRNWWIRTHPNFEKRMSPPNRAMLQSTIRGVTQNVEVLLARGADPNLKLRFGMPLIVFCAGMGRTDAVRAILDAGGDIAATSPSTGFTALHSAADTGNLALAHLLSDYGANWESRLKSGATPLMLAARKGHGDMIRFLLSCDAQVNHRTHSGTTALIFAAMYGHEEAVGVLLNSGADASIKTKQGTTALDYARRRKHLKVADLLEACQPQEATGANG